MEYLSKEVAEKLDYLLCLGLDGNVVDSKNISNEELNKNITLLHKLLKLAYIRLNTSGGYIVTIEGKSFYKEGGFLKQYDLQGKNETLQTAQLQLTQAEIKDIRFYKVMTVISILISVIAVIISLIK